MCYYSVLFPADRWVYPGYRHLCRGGETTLQDPGGNIFGPGHNPDPAGNRHVHRFLHWSSGFIEGQSRSTEGGEC